MGHGLGGLSIRATKEPYAFPRPESWPPTGHRLANQEDQNQSKFSMPQDLCEMLYWPTYPSQLSWQVNVPDFILILLKREHRPATVTCCHQITQSVRRELRLQPGCIHL